MTDTCSCPDCADDLPDDTSVLCFRLPDELSGVMDGDDALAVATIAVQDRLFARVLLPVPLDSSHRLCFSIWLSLPPGEAERVRSAWDRPGLMLVGTIANELPLWGLRGLPVLAARRDEPGGPPTVLASTAPAVEQLLGTTWPTQRVLAFVGQSRLPGSPADHRRAG